MGTYSVTMSRLIEKSAIFKRLLAPAFFAGLSLSLLGRPLVNRLSLVPWQISYMIDNLYRPGAEPILSMYPQNSMLFDITFQFFPWSAYALERIGGMDVPLWNPYAMAGLPFLANHQSSVFELTKLLGYLLNFEAIWLPSLSWSLTIALAGFFTFLFLRELELTYAASIIGGTSFALCGPMVVWLGWPHASTAIWLPFLLLCIEKIIRTQRLSWIAWMAIGIAFMFFAGHIQVAWFVISTCFIWTLFKMYALISSGPPGSQVWPRITLNLAAATLLGLSVASIQLWPMLEFTAQSSLAVKGRGLAEGESLIDAVQGGRWASPHGYAGREKTLLSLGLFVYPNLLGSPATEYFGTAGNTNEAAVYVGVINLALALSGLAFTRKNRRPAFFWAAVAILGAGASLSLPGLALINYLPLFNMANMGRARFIVTFALSVLAAFGVDAIFRQDRPGAAWIKPAAFVGITAILVGAIFIFINVAQRAEIPLPTARMMKSEEHLVAILVPAAAIIAIAWAGAKSHRRIIAQTFLIVLIAGELLVYGGAHHRGLDPGLVARGRDGIDWLQPKIGVNRITSFQTTADNQTSLFPNTSVLLGLQDIRGYEVIAVNRFERLQALVSGEDPRTTYKTFSKDFFNLAGVKYFVQSKNDPELDQLRSDGLVSIYEDRHTLIMRNQAALPRALVVYNTRRAGSTAQALDWFRRHEIDFRQQAIVENGPVLSGNQRAIPAEIVDYKPESVSIKVTADAPGFLVLSDAYYEGWLAFVDGKRARIHPANVAFRGILVPKGTHRVRFVYRPNSYYYSVYALYGGLISIIGLFIADAINRRRKRTRRGDRKLGR